MPEISAKKLRNRKQTLLNYKADKLRLSKSKVRVPLRYVENMLVEEVTLMLALKTLSFMGKITMQLKPIRKQLQDGTLNINEFITRHDIIYYNLYTSLEDIETEYKLMYGFDYDMLGTDKVSPFFDMQLGDIIKTIYNTQYPDNVGYACTILQTITKYLGVVNEYHDIQNLAHRTYLDGYCCDECDGSIVQYQLNQFEYIQLRHIIEKCNKVTLL